MAPLLAEPKAMRSNKVQRTDLPRPPIDAAVAVETPEHIAFRYQVAGPSRRMIAYLIDSLIRAGVVVVALLVIATMALMPTLREGSGGLVFVLLFAVEWGYYVLFESIMRGSTPGKAALRLRVVKAGGYPISFLDSVVRNLLRGADFLPFGYILGVIVMGFDLRFRRLGDMAAGTLVVVEERHSVSRPLALPPAQPEELAALPLRIHLPPEELDTLELFLRRLPALTPAREAELGMILAPMYARRYSIAKYADATRFLFLIYHLATAKRRVVR